MGNHKKMIIGTFEIIHYDMYKHTQNVYLSTSWQMCIKSCNKKYYENNWEYFKSVQKMKNKKI